MTGVFGIVRRDGGPVDPGQHVQLAQAIAAGGGGAAGLAPDLGRDAAGVMAGASPAEPQLCASGRLDNRDELVRELQSGGPPVRGSDADVILAAYRRWGEDAPARLLGDWCLAAWDQRRHRLFLARDQYGHGALHYFADERMVAFAPSGHALLGLDGVSAELDELYLGQYLISWTAYHGMRTSLRTIRRLPPAHCVTVTPEGARARCYRRIEDVPELRLASRSDYADGLREVFDEAVRVRLPAVGAVGVTLSGGLDSGSVAATAARRLGGEGRRLQAFTAVPAADTVPYVGSRFGDELPLARAVAVAAGNIDLRTLDSRHVTPVEAIRRALQIVGAPVHAASNQFWMLDMQRAAAEHGCEALLTGQMGNGGVSWPGSPLSQPWGYQLERLGPGTTVRRHLRRSAPRRLQIAWAGRGHRDFPTSAIDPAFARRLQLAQRRFEDPELFPRTPVADRLRTLKPGRLVVGDVYSRVSAASGVDVRDPTADVRVIRYVLSVPDRVFIDRDSGADRWLIREAMRGRLPDPVRLNARRGRQAGDLVPRLRASAAEVEAALAELAGGPAAAYLDVGHMRSVWAAVQREDTPTAFNRAVTVLTRGIMGGLYVNALADGGPRPALLRPS
jgi:asparagine synthase (glutamine-hydrolysing)